MNDQSRMRRGGGCLSWRLTLLWSLLIAVAASAKTATFQLAGGDQLRAEIVAETDAAWEIRHPALGQMTLPKTNATILPVTSEPAAAAKKKKTAKVVKKPKAPETYWQSVDKQLSFGLNGRVSTVHRQDWLAGFDLKKVGDKTRWDADLSYFYSETNDKKRENEGHVIVNHDWFINGNKDQFLFVRGQTNYDELTDWELRNSLFGGLGYRIVSSKRGDLQFRGGGGGSYEHGDVEEFKPEAIFASGSSKWKLSDYLSMRGELAVFPNVSDFDEYRATLRLEWLSKVPDVDGLSFKFGIRDTFDSVMSGKKPQNDFKYFAGIVYDL